MNSNLHFKYVCLWLHYGPLKETWAHKIFFKQIQAYSTLVFVLKLKGMKLATIRISNHSAFDLWFWILKSFKTFFIKKYCYNNNTLWGKISFPDGNLKQEVCRIRISNPSSLMLDLMKVSFVKMIDIGIMTWWQELQSKCKFQWFLTTRNNYK